MKIAKFQNRLQELESDFLSSDLLKGIVDFGTGIVKTLDTVIDKFGSINTILTAVGAVLSTQNVGRDKMYSLAV